MTSHGLFYGGGHICQDSGQDEEPGRNASQDFVAVVAKVEIHREHATFFNQAAVLRWLIWSHFKLYHCDPVQGSVNNHTGFFFSMFKTRLG